MIGGVSNSAKGNSRFEKSMTRDILNVMYVCVIEIKP